MFGIRDADERDGAACAAVYAPYVTDTVTTFEDVPPTPVEMGRRIVAARRAHAWLVATEDERVIGYAYGGPHHSRAAYRWSCEVSIYLERGRRRTGAGRRLYEALFQRLEERGFRMLLAGITQPNEASVRFHEAFGFELVGLYRNIGWKHGGWRDVTWSQLAMGDGPPSELR
ncbi:MAG TPA: GNAT family N-acetyltransferase [Pseudonocardia sp.]|jgi:phosphinothricin acetyltransferase|nr:GNAT family N-acetyltransferase [Pseudonocardia sp.]